MLEGKIALVTGASRGIGRAIALALAAQGAAVAVNYAGNRDAAEQTTADIAATGGAALPVQADVRDIEQVQAMIRQIQAELGTLDILINNAGILRDAPLMLMKPEHWDDVINTHLKGAYHCAKLGIRNMIAKRGGRVINIVSPSGIRGRAGQANYSAAKGGLIALTRTMALELSRFNITVNAVSPGVIATDMTERLPDKVRTELLNQIPLGRFGAAEDVARMVVFLCGPGGEYITGQVIHVDGGLVM